MFFGYSKEKKRPTGYNWIIKLQRLKCGMSHNNNMMFRNTNQLYKSKSKSKFRRLAKNLMQK